MKPVVHEPSAKSDPTRMSKVQLARLGIEVVDPETMMLKCVTCGRTWIPPASPSGELLPHYWVCPNNCNT